MPREALDLKIQREFCQTKYARKVRTGIRILSSSTLRERSEQVRQHERMKFYPQAAI